MIESMPFELWCWLMGIIWGTTLIVAACERKNKK